MGRRLENQEHVSKQSFRDLHHLLVYKVATCLLVWDTGPTEQWPYSSKNNQLPIQQGETAVRALASGFTHCFYSTGKWVRTL